MLAGLILITKALLREPNYRLTDMVVQNTKSELSSIIIDSALTFEEYIEFIHDKRRIKKSIHYQMSQGIPEILLDPFLNLNPNVAIFMAL